MVAYSDLTDPNAIVGYVFTIEGCPYAFSTLGVAGVVPDSDGKRDEDWCSDSIEWTLIEALAQKGFTWSERVTPTTAECEVSAPKIVIRDIVASSGVASGYPIATWLISRHDAAVGTLLDATLTDTSTTTIDVFDTSSFTNDQVVWNDREAVLTDNIISSAKLDITATGRGVYGSKARYHIVDEPNNYRPAVFNSWPGVDGRRCVLWKGILHADGDLYDPVPIWRGVVSSASINRDGDVELALEHTLKKVARTRIGLAGSAFQLQGYSTTSQSILWTRVQGGTAGTVTVNATQYLTIATYADTDSIASELTRQMQSYVSAHISYTGAPGEVRGRLLSLAACTWATLAIGSQLTLGLSTVSGEGTAPVSIADNVVYGLPEVFQEANTGQAMPLRFGSVAALSAGPGIYTSTSGYRYTARQVLAATSDKFRILLVPTPADIAGGTVISTTNRTFKGLLEIYDSNNRRFLFNGGNLPPGIIGGTGVVDPHGSSAGTRYYLVSPFVFRLVLDVRCDEWLDGLRSVVIDDPALSATTSAIDVDARDWASTTMGVDEQPAIDNRIRAATPGPFRSRRWLFDGSMNLLDLWLTNLQIVGGALTLRRSRISPNVFQVPLQSDVYDAPHNVTRDEMIAGQPDTWQRSPELIANVLSVKMGEENSTTEWIVRDQVSAAKYGDGAQISVDVRGIEFPDEVRANGNEALRRHISTRMTLWSNPWEEIGIEVPLTYLDTIYLLDRIKLAPYVSPDGTGYRSGATSTTRTGIVIEREIKANVIALKVVCPSRKRVSGFAPAVKVDTIVGAVVTVDTAYLSNITGGQSDYAGSNLGSYATEYGAYGTGCVANDGGAGLFLAGDRVKLIKMDATSQTVESVIVQSVNPAAGTITLTGAPVGVWNPATDWVDLIYDDYTTSGIQAGQKLFCYIGARTAGVIAATADRNYEWTA